MKTTIIDSAVQAFIGLLGIFFLASNPAFSKERIEGKKTNPQEAAMSGASLTRVYARSTFYNKDEPGCDPDTRKGKTSTCLRIRDVQAKGLGVVSVDPAIVPYGSRVIASDGRVFIAVDTGGDVKARTAAKEAAAKQGYGPKSAQHNAPVLDFYSNRQIGGIWDHFLIVPYREDRPFTDLKVSERMEYLDAVIASGAGTAQRS